MSYDMNLDAELLPDRYATMQEGFSSDSYSSLYVFELCSPHNKHITVCYILGIYYESISWIIYSWLLLSEVSRKQLQSLVQACHPVLCWTDVVLVNVVEHNVKKAHWYCWTFILWQFNRQSAFYLPYWSVDDKLNTARVNQKVMVLRIPGCIG